jgi:hypothetical protein
MNSKEYQKSIAKGATANQLTGTALTYLAVHGWEVWRNNTVGIFDVDIAAEKIVRMGQSSSGPEVKRLAIKKTLRTCYRKSHDRLGASDIIGFNKKTGRFIAIEIKAGTDKLSPAQSFFLDQVKKSGGVAGVVRSFEDLVNLISHA